MPDQSLPLPGTPPTLAKPPVPPAPASAPSAAPMPGMSGQAKPTIPTPMPPPASTPTAMGQPKTTPVEISIQPPPSTLTKAPAAPLPPPTPPAPPTIPNSAPPSVPPKSGVGPVAAPSIVGLRPTAPTQTGAMPIPPASLPPAPAPKPPAPPTASGIPAGSLPKPPTLASAVASPTLPTVPPAPPANKPKLAVIKESPLKFLPFLLGGLVIIGLVLFLISKILGGNKPTSVATTPTGGSNKGTTPTRTTVPSTQATVTYWGLWEPSEVMSDVFKDFEAANPGIKVNYVKQTATDYRQRLQTAIASGNGPDLFRFHASWVPMLRNELSPMPSSIMSSADFQKTFYPVASKQLQLNGQVVGVPLMYDGLGLYYNKDILKTAGVQPPTTWADLRTLASQLTVRSGDTIQRGGLAAGTATNVEHFSDILGLLILQNGGDPAKPTSTQVHDALVFYTNFAKVDKVWSDALPSSTVAFARGDVAMMIAPSWRAHEVLVQNPKLNFGIAPVPKLSENKIAWGSYWAEGVSSQSKNKDAAWKLLKYLSSAEVMKKMYSSQSQVRSFGELYSRVDLADVLAQNQYAAAYLTDAPQAQDWYLNSFTHDNGLNDALIKYYQDAITAVNQGKDPTEVLTTVDQGTQQTLRQYGLSTTSTGANTP